MSNQKPIGTEVPNKQSHPFNRETPKPLGTPVPEKERK